VIEAIRAAAKEREWSSADDITRRKCSSESRGESLSIWPDSALMYAGELDWPVFPVRAYGKGSR